MSMKWFFVILVGAVGSSLMGCPEKVEVDTSPSAAMRALVVAAKEGDHETFRKGLSKNFHLVIEEYQKLSETKPSLKGAFSYGTFMRAMALSDAFPKVEKINGRKATVRAEDKAGKSVKTKMVMENGVWKLEVPNGMVLGLDHFDEVESLAAGQKVAERPKTQVGGGGKADRMKNLAADASLADRNKAKALDAFDLGDLNGGEQMLLTALKDSPEDLELIVALGRLYVQKNEAMKAIGLFENHLKKDNKAVSVKHYLGMAYMFQNRPADAAAQWREVGVIDSAYSAKYKLDQRVAAAEEIAAKGQAAPLHRKPSAASQPTHGSPGPASQPAKNLPSK
jgi:cytochrome c-type biogenesis protein CcmH/NrfG